MTTASEPHPGVLVTPESLVHVLGVVYVHSRTSDGGDLYLTRFGLPFADVLAVENWYEKEWFETHRQRLQGTSAVYRVPTREVAGRRLDLVVKNSRVGEDVPVETRTLLEFINAEFNSPWEEFSLVMEMRDGHYGPPDLRLHTQEPLAIYVPPETMQLWQSGRSREKMNRIRAMHPGIDLDILRQYKLVYGWIQGKDVIETFEDIGLERDELQRHLAPVTGQAIRDMESKGYAVADMKPAHVIIGETHTRRIETMGRAATDADKAEPTRLVHDLVERGEYSIVDYELLVRTAPHEQAVKHSRRHHYLDDQRDRFVATELPPHLREVEIFGVPYIHGRVESTGGHLWVVGRNAELFDYFLPERWRKTPHWRLSENSEVYYTLTKDNVHVVWKVSKVGERPPSEPDGKAHERGYNSPFEEFAIAQSLGRNGIPTVYARAIYMVGSLKSEESADTRRYASHRHLTCPDGIPILCDDRNYITIRGYFNGPDAWVAKQDGQLCRPVDLPQAVSKGLISQPGCSSLVARVLRNLERIGYDGSLLQGNDLLLALDPSNTIVCGEDGEPEVRICNFELLAKR
ncbi:MAG: hypothetical protein A3K19_00985 [Lentisphaerae bacterium RIFOXYB12_FULL_65_16]|nr:MAG: hypothetical protein A3K18_19030 [Lentisphaerae bacterium RIFOXYA12_64_32]OGV85580.1 MAG: hypothetical protein A3K19_00985 [Lentisphaerae bacterium RIFOXYB12_FULL_65_16]